MLEKIRQVYKKSATLLAPAIFSIALHGSTHARDLQSVNRYEKSNLDTYKISRLLKDSYFASLYPNAWLRLYPFFPEKANFELKLNSAISLAGANEKTSLFYIWRLRALYASEEDFEYLLDKAERLAFYDKDSTLQAAVASMLSFNYAPESENFIEENAKFFHVLKTILKDNKDYLFALFNEWGFSFREEKEKGLVFKISVEDLYTKQSAVTALYLETLMQYLKNKFKINPNFVTQVSFSLARLAYAIEQSALVETKKAVSDAFSVYYRELKESKNKKVFKKNTVLIDNDELWPDGKKRFGYKKLREKISKKSNLIYFDTDPETKKILFLKAVETQSNLTIFLDVHGNRDFFSVSDNPQNPVYISAKEFARALRRRIVENKLDAPTIINSSCFSYDFMVSVLSELEDLDKVPVFINMVESGQYGWSVSSRQLQSFHNWLLSKDTLHDLAKSNFKERASKELMSNPSIFVPLRYKIPERNRKFKNKWLLKVMQLG